MGMNAHDASDEIHSAVVDFCKSAEEVDGIQRVNLMGDGNLGGCGIVFEDEHDFNYVKVWGGNQFRSDTVRYIDSIDPSELDPDASNIDPEDRRASKYGPIELEIQIDDRSKQITTFGWTNQAEGDWQVRGMPDQPRVLESTETDLEWAENPEPGLLKARQKYIDDGPTVELDIR